MFYTRVAKVVAALGFFFGVLILGTAIFSYYANDPSSHTLSGKTVDYGFLCMVAAITLGVIAEISQSLAALVDAGKRGKDSGQRAP